MQHPASPVLKNTANNPSEATGKKALWRMMRPYLWRFRWRFLMVLLAAPLSVAMAAITPYLIKVAIDNHIAPAAQAGAWGGHFQPLLWIVGLAAGSVLFGYLADAGYVALLQRIGHQVLEHMRNLIYARTLRLPKSYFDKHPIGGVLTRVTSDIESLTETLANNALQLVLDFFKSVVFLVIMWQMSSTLTLAVLVLFPLLYLLIRFFQARIHHAFLGARQALSVATAYLQECLSGMKTVQLFGAESVAVQRFVQKNRVFYRAQNTSNFYDALMYSVVEGTTTATLALIIWTASGQLLTGALTLGVLAAFMEYIQRLFVPVREFSQQAALLQRALAALSHISDLCEQPLDPAEKAPSSLATNVVTKNGHALSSVQDKNAAMALQHTISVSSDTPMEPFCSLVFDNVRFRYTSGATYALNGVSFEVKKGQSLAIVGRTGSGKSTIMRLLMRAYGGYEGEILLNGRPLQSYSADPLNRMLSIVHQGVFLFQGSIAFNIHLGRPWVSMAQVERAAQFVQADGFIQQQVNRYAFEVAQGGNNLSAGQGQLLSFARAVAGGSGLILLDEATSSVDSLTEHLIQQAVERLYAEKAVIAIAHRLSTIRKADTILVLHQGEVVEQGGHAALFAKNGHYTSLLGEIEADAKTQA